MARSIPNSNTRDLDRLSKRILLQAGCGYPASDAELRSQVSDARHWNYSWYASVHIQPVSMLDRNFSRGYRPEHCMKQRCRASMWSLYSEIMCYFPSLFLQS